jgi:3-dehydroquinate synthase class II
LSTNIVYAALFVSSTIELSYRYTCHFQNKATSELVPDFVFLKVIPAENIVAAFQRLSKVFAISKNHSEAQVFFEVKLLYD